MHYLLKKHIFYINNKSTAMWQIPWDYVCVLCWCLSLLSPWGRQILVSKIKFPLMLITRVFKCGRITPLFLQPLICDGCETLNNLDMTVSSSCWGNIPEEPARGRRRQARDLDEESRVGGSADFGVCVRAEGSELTCQKLLCIFSSFVCGGGRGGGRKVPRRSLLFWFFRLALVSFSLRASCFKGTRYLF